FLPEDAHFPPCARHCTGHIFFVYKDTLFLEYSWSSRNHRTPTIKAWGRKGPLFPHYWFGDRHFCVLAFRFRRHILQKSGRKPVLRGQLLLSYHLWPLKQRFVCLLQSHPSSLHVPNPHRVWTANIPRPVYCSRS